LSQSKESTFCNGVDSLIKKETIGPFSTNSEKIQFGIETVILSQYCNNWHEDDIASSFCPGWSTRRNSGPQQGTSPTGVAIIGARLDTHTIAGRRAEVGSVWCTASVVFGDLAARGNVIVIWLRSIVRQLWTRWREPFPRVIQVWLVVCCSTGSPTDVDA